MEQKTIARLWREKNRERELQNAKNHRMRHPLRVNTQKRKWYQNNPKKKQAINIISHGNRRGRIAYPLADTCEFCGRTWSLEHGHIDYDYPEIYLTVCHQCKCWMGRL